MNLFEKFLYLLSGTMETPVSYGWFHLTFVGVAAALTVLLCVFFRKAKEKTVKIILLTGWGIIVLLEIYKQLIFSIGFDPVKWDYQWYAFPFQLCSSPLYLLPAAALIKNVKLRDAVRMFLATFSLFGGLAVFVYPNDVFISLIGINIQTMVHHGSQVVLGIYLGVILLRDGKMTLRTLAGACAVFTAMVATALSLNLIAPLFTNETFNMYYIGPRFPCSLVILSDIYPKIPYPLFLLLYIFGFALLAALLFGIFRLAALVSALLRKKRGKKAV